MAEIIVSLLVTAAIPTSIVTVIFLLRRRMSKDNPPSFRQWVQESGQAIAITLAICLGISLVFQWTGFFESQYYQPRRTDDEEQKRLGLDPEPFQFNSKDGTQLHGWVLRSKKQPAKDTVIHFHGSGRNITFWIKDVAWLADNGYDVVMFDYRGFGESQGSPDREGVIADATAAIKEVRSSKEIGAERIMLWGQSLGGQLAIVAADRAGLDSIECVIADATYASYSLHIKDKTARMGPLWLTQWANWVTTSDDGSAILCVGNLGVPLLLIHGTKDDVVQPYHSERLFKQAAEPKEIWRVEGAGHLDVLRDARWQAKLIEYLDSV